MIHYNRIAGQNVRRIEALSDGVFAIAFTLLVDEIKVPEAKAASTETDLLHSLNIQQPDLLLF